jgi:hypothetical protein
MRDITEFLSLTPAKFLYHEREWKMGQGTLPDEANLPQNSTNPLHELKRWSEERIIHPPIQNDRLEESQESWAFSITQYEGLDTQDQDPETWNADYVSKVTMLLKYLSKYTEETNRRTRHQIPTLDTLKGEHSDFLTNLREDWHQVVTEGRNYAYILLCAMLARGGRKQ